MLTVIHEWTCDICGEKQKKEDGYKCLGERYVQYLNIPSDWRWIDGKFVCPKHKITIEN